MSDKIENLVRELDNLKTPEALALSRELEGVIKRARSLVAGEPTEVGKRNKEIQARRKEYIRKLVYVGGNSKNGLLKRIKLTDENLADMGNLGMRYSYDNDELINRTAFGAESTGGNRVVLEFPDGISGELYFKYSPEDGSIFYNIRKNCKSSEDRAA